MTVVFSAIPVTDMEMKEALRDIAAVTASQKKCKQAGQCHIQFMKTNPDAVTSLVTCLVKEQSVAKFDIHQMNAPSARKTTTTDESQQKKIPF